MAQEGERPRVPRLQPVRIDGRFVNPAFVHPPQRLPEEGGPAPEDDEERGFRDFVKWRLERRKYAEHEPVVERVAREGPVGAPPEEGIRVTWVGHSSTILQVDGKTLLLDPVWSKRLAGVVKRHTEPGVKWEDVPPVDALVVSHDHYDHLDAATVKRLPRATPVFVPTGVASWFLKRGFTNVVERSWWEDALLDGLRLTCVPAQHFSGRTPWGRDRTLWAGWVVEGARGGKAYYAGDSGYFPGFHEIGEAFPGLDVALIPIGAYSPRWFMAPVHVDPPEGGQAFLDVGAREMIPVHWGAFRLADEPIDEPPRALREWWAQKGLEPARLRVPKLGETLEVKAMRASPATSEARA